MQPFLDKMLKNIIGAIVLKIMWWRRFAKALGVCEAKIIQ